MKYGYQSETDLLCTVFTNDSMLTFVFFFVTVLLITLSRKQSGIQHINEKSRRWGRMKQLQKFERYCRGGRCASLQMLLVLYSEFIVCRAIVMEKRKRNGVIMVTRGLIFFFLIWLLMVFTT